MSTLSDFSHDRLRDVNELASFTVETTQTLGVGMGKMISSVFTGGMKTVQVIKHSVGMMNDTTYEYEMKGWDNTFKEYADAAEKTFYTKEMYTKLYGAKKVIDVEANNTKDTEALTLYGKLIEFLKKVIAKLQTGLFYAAIMFFILAVIFMVLIVMSGKKLDKFLKMISDMFAGTYKLLVSLMTQTISGILSLDFAKVQMAVTKAFSKFSTTMDEIIKEAKGSGLDNVLYATIIFGMLGAMTTVYLMIQSGGKKADAKTKPAT